MTPAEFRAARDRLGLSAEEAGYVLGVAGRTVRKWEADDGTRPVPPMARRVMGWLLDGYTPPQMRWILDGNKPRDWPSRNVEAAAPLPVAR